MIRYFKVGGLRFLRIGRLQVSWCIVKRKKVPTPVQVEYDHCFDNHLWDLSGPKDWGVLGD